MARGGQLERLRLLGLVSVGDEDIRSTVKRHSILLGKLAGDPRVGGILFGMESTNIGEIKLARGTSNLTLTTTAQSIVGDGDSSKVRLLLPTIGDWLTIGSFDFEVTATDPDECIGLLFVNDSASNETGGALFGKGQVDRAVVSQTWKVTTTAVNTPVELKAKKETNAGVAVAVANSTAIMATRTR